MVLLPRSSLRALGLGLGVLATLGSTAAAANCTRADLQTAADSLVAALTAGNPALLTPVAADLAYTENRQPATLASGILAAPLKPDHNRSSLDTTQCATYTEFIAASAPKPTIVGVQMFWTGPRIARIDAIHTSAGDWLFNATGTLYWASREDWGPIPAAQRDTRAVIQAAADAYCDVFSNKSVVVPWGTPCARLEGGSYTGNGGPHDSCNVGIPSGVSLTQRRYVIDETVGAVDVMMAFADLPDSHEFRVEGGKLRYVHTMTVMTGGKGKGGGRKGKGMRRGVVEGIRDQLAA
ncbi:hypothetical protein SPI_06293 [Niveomyces insectorum RCEF 264]|uniref:DUF8021 domain-containing protein n=1 Tax=Niveomyces insectorum RCEF 264 TaxID=1081102 RepID=A0A167RZN8_9HYPO|nr:hypothetical protein SPI_06293 [Niveomyces insectorum RCEF 264]